MKAEFNKKVNWRKPDVKTIENENVAETIVVSACSRHSGCFPGAGYFNSIPGFPPVEIM